MDEADTKRGGLMFGKSAAALHRASISARTGCSAEDRALTWLSQRGLQLLQRNERVARGPSRRGGEIDLIMRERDGTVVFVEVRARSDSSRGGAAASVTPAKQASLIYAASHYLLRFDSLPVCRFDVVAVDGQALDWLKAAFEAR
jgi:putative endonuclease